jgi:outer membrane protein
MRANRWFLLVSGFWLLATGVFVTDHGSPVTAFAAEEAPPDGGTFPDRSLEDVAPLHKVGVVNLTRVFEECKKTKDSDLKMSQASHDKEAERERLVTEIKSLREEMVLLNEEARAERQESIEEKLRHLASFDRQTKESLRRQRDETVQMILNEIESTVDFYAKEHGFDLILVDRAVLYGTKTLDVTEDILTLLNQRYAQQRR